MNSGKGHALGQQHSPEAGPADDWSWPRGRGRGGLHGVRDGRSGQPVPVDDELRPGPVAPEQLEPLPDGHDALAGG